MSECEFWPRVGPEIDWISRQVRRLGVPDRDLEDVVQEVLVSVHRRWGDYDSGRPLRPWLFGFALRVASDFRRRSSNRQVTVPLDPDLADEGPCVDEQVEAAARRALLLGALETLDLDRRALIVLIELEEMTMPEAVEILGIPLNTGYSRLRAARAALAEAVRATVRRAS